MQSQAKIIALRQSLAHTIVGQTALLDRLVIALLCGGHVLLEGLPGLAKRQQSRRLQAPCMHVFSASSSPPICSRGT